MICNARGCQTGPPSDPNCTKCPLVYHMCNKTSCGDKTNWDEQALHLLGLAQPHLISGALRGVWLGDELTASGVGSHPHVPGALSFRDLEKYINLVRGFLDVHVAPARRAAGVKEDLILYYMSSDYSRSWPYIPRNLTLFSLDDYSPAWTTCGCLIRERRLLPIGNQTANQRLALRQKLAAECFTLIS